MIHAKEFIVVEFDLHARFMRKRTLSEHNERVKAEWRSGELSNYLKLMGVFEKEEDANDFISEFNDIDKLIEIVLKEVNQF